MKHLCLTELSDAGAFVVVVVFLEFGWYVVFVRLGLAISLR
jgi:hypothetical protein